MSVLSCQIAKSVTLRFLNIGQKQRDFSVLVMSIQNTVKLGLFLGFFFCFIKVLKNNCSNSEAEARALTSFPLPCDQLDLLNL